MNNHPLPSEAIDINAKLKQASELEHTQPQAAIKLYLELLKHGNEQATVKLFRHPAPIACDVEHVELEPCEDGQQYLIKGLQAYSSIGASQDDTKARLYFEKAAMLGNAFAHSCLAHIHLNGRGVAKSLIVSDKYLKQAMALDCGYAILYFATNSYEKNENYQAVSCYYKRAAEQGYAKAQLCIAMQTKSPEALTWLFKSALQGYPYAQYNLGVKLTGKEATEDNINEAIGWLKLAAAQDFFHSYSLLGRLYLNKKIDIQENTSTAVDWLTKGAEKGEPNAQVILAQVYIKSSYPLPLSEEERYTEAFHWLRKAAHARHGKAIDALNLIYLSMPKPLLSDQAVEDIRKDYFHLRIKSAMTLLGNLANDSDHAAYHYAMCLSHEEQANIIFKNPSFFIKMFKNDTLLSDENRYDCARELYLNLCRYEKVFVEQDSCSFANYSVEQEDLNYVCYIIVKHNYAKLTRENSEKDHQQKIIENVIECCEKISEDFEHYTEILFILSHFLRLSNKPVDNEKAEKVFESVCKNDHNKEFTEGSDITFFKTKPNKQPRNTEIMYDYFDSQNIDSSSEDETDKSQLPALN